MNSIRCGSCGLANFASEMYCRRCSAQLISATGRKSERRPRRFSIVSAALCAAVAFGAYQLYLGGKSSIEEVNRDDTQRVAAQAPQQQPAGLSRSEQDRQRATTYGDAVKDSPALAEKRRQEEQTQKAIQQASGGQ